MVELLSNLPSRHLFYLDFDSYPIALAFEDYKVVETRVRRVKEGTKEFYLFSHLVEHS